MPLIKNIVRFTSAVFILTLMFFYTSAAWALASVSISPSPSYTGNYTVSWTGNDGGAGGSLYENDAPIASIGSSNSGSYAISGKPVGNYSYYIIYYNRSSPGSTRSPSTTVTVKPPLPPPPPATGVTFVYDALGRVVKVTYPNGTIIDYGYDAAGNRTQLVKKSGI